MHVPVNIGLYCDKETAEKSRRRMEAVTGEPPHFDSELSSGRLDAAKLFRNLGKSFLPY